MAKDRGTKFLSDSVFIDLADRTAGYGERDYNVTQRISDAVVNQKRALNFVPDANEYFTYTPIRNSYHATIIERIEDDLYRVLRQDQRIGTAKARHKGSSYRAFEVGDIVSITRPQEKEDENHWYIVTPFELQRHHVYGVDVAELDNNKFKYSVFNDNVSSSTLEDFEEVFKLEDTKIVIKQGGQFHLSFNGTVTGRVGPDTGAIFEAHQGIAGASGKYVPSSAFCKRLVKDPNTNVLQPDGTTHRVWNTVEGADGQVNAGKVIHAKIYDGEYYVDLDTCN